MKTIYVKIQVQDDFKEPAKAIQGIVDSDGWGFPFTDIEQITLPSDKEIEEYGDNSEAIDDFMPRVIQLHIGKKIQCRKQGAKWFKSKII